MRLVLGEGSLLYLNMRVSFCSLSPTFPAPYLFRKEAQCLTQGSKNRLHTKRNKQLHWNPQLTLGRKRTPRPSESPPYPDARALSLMGSGGGHIGAVTPRTVGTGVTLSHRKHRLRSETSADTAKGASETGARPALTAGGSPPPPVCLCSEETSP